MTEREKLVAKIMDIGYDYKNCNAMVREQQALRAVNMLKEYEAKAFDLGAVSERLEKSLGKPKKGNDYRLEVMDGRYWIVHNEVESGEPMKQWIDSVLNVR